MSKKILVGSIFCILAFNSVCFSAEVLKLEKAEKKTITLTPTVNKTQGSIVIDDREKLEILINEQQQNELEDLEMLWKATVDNNDLIKFTMKKLNTPESQKRLHSSLMAKSVSAIVYGASFIPSFMGSDMLMQSAAFTTGRLANNFINKENAQTTTPLTDTELIELAGTIESLQDVIISTYYNYKGALNKLKDTRAKMILYNRNYSNAIKKNDALEIVISSSLYDDLKMQEFEQEQIAKKYYLELERLAGKETISKLNMAQFALKNQLVNPDKVNQ